MKLETLHSEEFADLPPGQVVPALADRGEYIASEWTMYRILHEEKEQNHRGRSQEPYKHAKPTSYCATAPNQVWTWDITYLKGLIKGSFYYLYRIIDIFSRDIVGWEVWEDESAEHAKELITRACLLQKRLTTNRVYQDTEWGFSDWKSVLYQGHGTESTASIRRS